ncbi:hypothetical protein [Sanguibacter sp. Z1732]|uniref:hypothetical protein n=1 Tax=Sanguibacter sp. Z1732 TaxID=3435412 RepID=UPI003D9CAD9E
MFELAAGHDPAAVVEDDRAGAGGALIDCEDVLAMNLPFAREAHSTEARTAANSTTGRAGRYGTGRVGA